jgi:hypothetical protein
VAEGCQSLSEPPLRVSRCPFAGGSRRRLILLLTSAVPDDFGMSCNPGGFWGFPSAGSRRAAGSSNKLSVCGEWLLFEGTEGYGRARTGQQMYRKYFVSYGKYIQDIFATHKR